MAASRETYDGDDLTENLLKIEPRWPVASSSDPPLGRLPIELNLASMRSPPKNCLSSLSEDAVDSLPVPWMLPLG